MQTEGPNLRAARFLTSAHTPAQWPADTGCEVAFAGRSNVGKSSALNAILGHRGLARTSKTPGRTQQIIFFAIDRERRLVDLPGYGYAKVPEAVRRHWGRTVSRYLGSRRSLRGVVVAMDARRPMTELDVRMLEWSLAHGLPSHILLTKSDKLSRGQAAATLQRLGRELSGRGHVSVQLFSARTGLGVESARDIVTAWLAPEDAGVFQQQPAGGKGSGQ